MTIKPTIRTHHEHFIGGQWVSPASGRYFEFYAGLADRSLHAAAHGHCLLAPGLNRLVIGKAEWMI